MPKSLPLLLTYLLLAGALAAQERPNFIVILTDDQGYQDLGCFGSPDIKTPQIDRMATEGMRFTSFYAAPMCTPARISLLTGCYPKRTGHNPPRGVLFYHDTIGLNTKETTIPEVLSHAGYTSICIGKWHVGKMPGMMPMAQGFDEFYGTDLSNNQRYRFFDNEKQKKVNRLPPQSEWTGMYTDKAIEFIDRAGDKPFFVYLSHIMPHIPLSASEAFQGKSEAGLYGDTIEELDHHTGRLLQHLRDKRLSEKTYVIFVSDNGPYLKHKPDAGSALPLAGGKFSIKEGGLRVPCVIWAPGRVPAGKRSDAVGSVKDLLPTFASLAGIDPDDVRPAEVMGRSGEMVPNVLDGHDISDLMHGKSDAASAYDNEGYLYFQRRKKGKGSEVPLPEARAIRMGKWKLFSGKRGDAELYDLDQDIGETTNVAAQHPDVVERLRTKMLEKDKELEAHMRPMGSE